MTIQELAAVIETHTKLINGVEVGGEAYHNAVQVQRQMDHLAAEIRSLNRDIERIKENRDIALARVLEERDTARRLATAYMSKANSTKNYTQTPEDVAKGFRWDCWDNFKKPKPWTI